jgi:hypothetical protein
VVAVSVVIAIVASSAALWIAFHLTVAWQMGVAARFSHDGSHTAPQISWVSNDFLAYAVFLLSLIIMAVDIRIIASLGSTH